MSEYIEFAVRVPKDDADLFIARFGRENVKILGFLLGEEIVRCRDCKHATVSSLGHVKYCEMFILPDTDGYGADPQVCLPLDFFCGYGELRGDAE